MKGRFVKKEDQAAMILSMSLGANKELNVSEGECEGEEDEEKGMEEVDDAEDCGCDIDGHEADSFIVEREVESSEGTSDIYSGRRRESNHLRNSTQEPELILESDRNRFDFIL